MIDTTELPESLRQLILEHQLYLEEVAPLKTRWAEYSPWPFESYKAAISIGSDCQGRARYLILLHEIAHYLSDQEQTCGRRPHGKEWQAIYQRLVQANIHLFSPDQDQVLDMFNRYTAKKENNLIELLTPAA